MGAIDRDALTLVDGTTFCVGAPSGDLLGDRAHGLFVRDVRVVSRWALRVDGDAGEPVHSGTRTPFAGRVLIHVAAGGADEGALLLVRERRVGEGMREDLRLRNDTARSRQCTVSLEVGVDFADLFAVKTGHEHHTEEAVTVAGPGHLVARGRRHGREHRVEVWADGGASALPGRLEWWADVPARGEWTAAVTVHVMIDGHRLVAAHPAVDDGQGVASRLLRPRSADPPRVETPDRDLAATLVRGVEDLGALRIFDPAHPERAVLAAGVPWYMALFGRDALLTALMLLPVDPDVALGTLQTLADHQGRSTNPASDEQPGRIPHEIRFGPPGALAPDDGGDDYGAADATALFVIVLGELARWTGLTPEIEALLPHADRALGWMDSGGDPDGDGFVEYARTAPGGWRHQGWKDSDDAVRFADGRAAEPPIALAEVQAYGIAAHRARAALADALESYEVAREHRERARELRRRFLDRFWIPGRSSFAMALDAGKRPVDAVASHLGHLLWAGVVDPGRARAVADHLLSPALFSGWGVRTLATTMAAYDPMSHHNGSVWPHDTALAAAGLLRYGFIAEGRRVARGLLDAATAFDHRLPELFCGFDRAGFDVPVPYPASCSPQAWASAAPLALVRALLRLEPDVPEGTVGCGPVLAVDQLPFAVRGLRIGGRRVDVVVDEAGWSVAGLPDDGLRVRPVG